MDSHRRVVALILTAGSTLIGPTLQAASPPNLVDDINWFDSGGEYDSENKIYDARFGGVGDIEIAFNHARREEERQLGLSPGTLGSLDLPSQAVWDALSDDEKALFLVNAERTARAGMRPSVIGLPLAGIEAHIDAISHAYGDRLHDNDLRGHYHDGPPSYRIERDAVIGTRHNDDILYPADPSQNDPAAEAPTPWEPSHGDGSPHNFGDGASCHEFLTRSENLAYYASTAPIAMPVERSIYSFIYDDAGSHWGHREAVLLQDNALQYEDRAPGTTGFDNNHGSSTTEGFMGFYVRASNRSDNPNNTYEPFGGGFQYGTVVVMNFFDPVGSGCDYSVTKRSEALPAGDGDIAVQAFDDIVQAAPGTSVEIAPTDNDAGAGSGSTVEVIRPPRHGAVSALTATTIRYSAPAGFEGTDTLDYRLTTARGRTSEASVTIRVAFTDTGDKSSSPPADDGGQSGSTAPTTADDGSSDSDSSASAGGGSHPLWLATLALLPLARRGTGPTPGHPRA